MGLYLYNYVMFITECIITTYNSINTIILTFYSLRVTWCATSLTFNNCTLCPHCIYVFCIYLGTNRDLCHLQHKQIGFYNPHEKCLQRGTDCVFKYSGLRFVCKGLITQYKCNHVHQKYFFPVYRCFSSSFFHLFFLALFFLRNFHKFQLSLKAVFDFI